MTQQPNPPLGGDEEKVVAWRWRFDGDSSGPWHYGSEAPGTFRFGAPEEIQPLYAAPVLPVEVREPFTVDDLAQEIRRVDGNHDLGAGALAEALSPFIIERIYRGLATITGDA